MQRRHFVLILGLRIRPSRHEPLDVCGASLACRVIQHRPVGLLHESEQKANDDQEECENQKKYCSICVTNAPGWLAAALSKW